MNINKITILVPCYNEEKLINKFTDILVERCSSLLINYEIIFIDDGSTDSSFNQMKNKINTNKNIKIIRLSKNYGFHIAISAGIDQVSKDSSIIIVCPIDDVELSVNFSKLIEKYNEGCEIVWMTRKTRNKNFVLKLMTRFFYKLFIFFSGFKNYPKNGTSALFLISKRVSLEFKRFKESNRVVNIIIYSMGFKQGFVEYEENINLRSSSYTFFKRLKIAIDSIVSHSYMPMRIISLLGIIVSIFAFIFTLNVFFDYYLNDIDIEGWTTVVILISILGGIQLLTLGILGEYLWRSSSDAKERPLYLIDKKEGFD